MSDEVKPALTHHYALVVIEGSGPRIIYGNLGFTREDATALRTIFQANVVTREMQSALNLLCQKVEALLPPETQK